MEYSKTIIDFTKTSNIPNLYQEIVYELPNEEFWITIKDLFENKTFQKQAQVVAHILGDCDGPIERKSFVKRNDAYYPLLNYGMITDYYKMLLSSASESERHDHIIETIHSLLENTFNFSDNPPNRVLINPKIISNDLKSKIVDKGLIFATATKNNIIIAVDQSAFPKNSFFVDTINKIEQELVKDELCIIEPYLRDPTKGHEINGPGSEPAEDQVGETVSVGGLLEEDHKDQTHCQGVGHIRQEIDSLEQIPQLLNGA